MSQFICSVCNTPLVCPKCSKRKLNAQAQAVDECIQAYLAARNAILDRPYPGKPPVGAVVRWLGQQATRELGVATFKHAVNQAVEAHRIDPVGHYAFPQRVPLFVTMIPDLLGNWVERARDTARVKREIAARRNGLEPSEPAPVVTAEQRAVYAAKRERLARQIECLAQLRFNQRKAEDCGGKPECVGCPQRETPGRERRHGTTGGLKAAGEGK